MRAASRGAPHRESGCTNVAARLPPRILHSAAVEARLVLLETGGSRELGVQHSFTALWASCWALLRLLVVFKICGWRMVPAVQTGGQAAPGGQVLTLSHPDLEAMLREAQCPDMCHRPRSPVCRLW